MNCSTVKYSDHAVIQMFKRNIDTFDIEIVLKEGEIIKEYPDDKPFPSLLMLGCVKGRAIHLVVAVEKNNGSLHHNHYLHSGSRNLEK